MGHAVASADRQDRMVQVWDRILHPNPTACTLVLSVLALALVTGCGDHASSGRASTSAERVTTATAPVAASAPELTPWRLVRRPIVVVDVLPNGDRTFQVYFRLNRPLSTRRNAVEVLLEGVWNLNVSGTGFDETTPADCYMRYFDNYKAFPR
jgi:hypothetical protein